MHGGKYTGSPSSQFHLSRANERNREGREALRNFDRDMGPGAGASTLTAGDRALHGSRQRQAEAEA